MTAPTIEQSDAAVEAARGSWLSAVIYDPLLWWAERAGMSERRRRLLTSARGSVLEIGAGTGLNLAHYPNGLDRLVLAEPEKHMAKRLEQRLDQGGRGADVIRAPAEALPFDDDVFDAVVSTLVLCTVENPQRALREIRRVLRPDGALLFIEHVRSDEPPLARWQDRLHGPWQAFADGCNCNRKTLDLISAEGFTLAELNEGQWRRMPPIVRPLISGRATRSG